MEQCREDFAAWSARWRILDRFQPTRLRSTPRAGVSLSRWSRAGYPAAMPEAAPPRRFLAPQPPPDAFVGDDGSLMLAAYEAPPTTTGSA